MITFWQSVCQSCSYERFPKVFCCFDKSGVNFVMNLLRHPNIASDFGFGYGGGLLKRALFLFFTFSWCSFSCHLNRNSNLLFLCQILSMIWCSVFVVRDLTFVYTSIFPRSVYPKSCSDCQVEMHFCISLLFDLMFSEPFWQHFICYLLLIWLLLLYTLPVLLFFVIVILILLIFSEGLCWNLNSQMCILYSFLFYSIYWCVVKQNVTTFVLCFKRFFGVFFLLLNI